MATQERESALDRESRLLLIRFLSLTDSVLDRILNQLVLPSRQMRNTVSDNLRLLWQSAQASSHSVQEALRIGINRRVRKALDVVAMFGEQLKAKFALLSFDIREGLVKSILTRLNSMLDSLAEVFSPLHAVKEFKEHVEATIEWLRDVPETISLADLLNNGS